MSRAMKIRGPQKGMQTEFIQSGETEVFYGGQAGGGKSEGILLDASAQLPIPGYRAIIFRRKYTDLEDLIHKARMLYPHVPINGAGAKYNDSKHNFVWPNNSIIMFRHMQHLKDMYNYTGQEYDYIAFDELPQFPKLAYVYLFSRLRGPNPNIKRYMRSTGNPDGEGMLWVKNRFVDVNPPLTRGWFKTVLGKDMQVPEGTEGAISRKFVPCIRSENKILMDNDPGYEDRLDQLPEDKKRALKQGIWTIMDKPNQLVLVADWERAVNGDNKFHDNGKYTIGADFGTYDGVDKSVEFLGIGNRPYRCRSWPKTYAPVFAQILADTASSVDQSNVMIGVDSIGPGVGVADDLELHHKLGSILDRCTHKDPIYDAKYIGEIQFNDLRSQMCWKFKTDMEEGDIDLSLFQTQEGYFEDFNALQEEVLVHTFRVFNGKLIVISKEELRKAENLGRSPDFFDALVIWNWTRRHHYEQAHDLDGEYKIDAYQVEWFRREKEYEEGEEAAYPEEHYDEAEYED